MRVAHAADTHLGYQAYNRMAPNGLNQRATDVALAFRAMVDGMIAAKPDLVLFAGDFFDQPKPSNAAIRFAVKQLQRLHSDLPGVPVVIVSGNHDENRRLDTGAILPMFADLGLADVAQGDAQQFVYPALDLRVVAVPNTAGATGEIPESKGTERWQVLLAHAEVQGVYRKNGERACGQLPADVLNGPWSAVCLGDYHICHRVSDRVYYPGSTEFTSSNPWSEIGTPKSWLLWDLESGEVTPQPIPMARPIYDLEPLDASGLSAEQVDAAIAERISAQDIAGAMVRLKVLDIPTAVSRALDFKTINQAKARALALRLDLRPPERVHSPATAAYIALRGRPLSELFTEWMKDWTLTPGLERQRFVELADEVWASSDGVDASETQKGAA